MPGCRRPARTRPGPGRGNVAPARSAVRCASPASSTRRSPGPSTGPANGRCLWWSTRACQGRAPRVGPGRRPLVGRPPAGGVGPASSRRATRIRGGPLTAARDGQDQQRQPARNRDASGGNRGMILVQVARNSWFLMVLLSRCRLPRVCRAAQPRPPRSVCLHLSVRPLIRLQPICRTLSVGAGRQVRLARWMRVACFGKEGERGAHLRPAGPRPAPRRGRPAQGPDGGGREGATAGAARRPSWPQRE
jgi:hypothetical protein